MRLSKLSCVSERKTSQHHQLFSYTSTGTMQVQRRASRDSTKRDHEGNEKNGNRSEPQNLESHLQGGNINCWLFSQSCFLTKSPSRQFLKMTVPQELKARESIHDFIIRLGSQLKLDGRTILASTVYVNRYYMRVPISSSKYYVASAALAISSKLNDTYRQPDKIALQACQLKNPDPSVVIDEQSDMFWRWRDQLLYREELILKTLNFDLNIELPYQIREQLAEIPADGVGFFAEKRDETLKGAISLVEILSSLPILITYDMNTVFGTALIVVVYEARKSFDDATISLPENYLLNNLGVDPDTCFACYKYIKKLLKYAEQDPQVVSNKLSQKRLKFIEEKIFKSVAGEAESVEAA